MKYRVGTILRGNKEGHGDDKNHYRIVRAHTDKFGRPVYDVVKTDNETGYVYEDIAENTIDAYVTDSPFYVKLDEGLFTL